MTRPSVIRADTLDLQGSAAPATKHHPNHSHQPPDTAPGTSASSIAPHQAQILREVAQETAEAETHNPTVSWSDGSANDTDKQNAQVQTAMYHQKQQDDLAIAQNGGVSSADEDDMDCESGSDMDDDLMDKISSSPSIEDGALYPALTPVAWPRRESSLTLLPLQLSTANAWKTAATTHCFIFATQVYHDEKESWMLLSGGAALVLDRTLNCDDKNQVNLTTANGFTGALVLNRKSSWAFVSTMVTHFFANGAERDQVEAWLSLKWYHPDALRNHDGHVLLHCQGSRDTVPRAHPVPVDLCLQLPTQGNGVVDQSSQSIDSFHYDNTLDDVNTYTDDECLLQPEDIDFEFVYALHTFVATVEGQANATKGDTMVLLDDSNSYWWLVRVVKDSSIGYLPAEHIETPTERLARLNKHRNIDLSATMLGDQAQKQKNSFKSMRRRRKTVTFSEPTYVDYSDFDYSTDDEDIDELFGSRPSAQQQHRQQTTQQNFVDDGATDESATVEPLKTRIAGQDKTGATQSSAELQMEDASRSSQESLEDRNDGISRSRNMVVRNTDSFFKDDSVETKKITLTPNLLRDDNTPRQSNESTTKDGRSTSSMDKIERELVSDREKKKLKDKDKKDKDKKSGGLRGFFSRKDKKKAGEDDDESFGKRSIDMMSDSRNSDDRSIEEHQQLSPDRTASQRQPSKLQKIPPSMSKTPAGIMQKPVELSSYLAEGRNNDVSNVPPVSMRIVGPDMSGTQHVSSNEGQDPDGTFASASKVERSVVSKLVPITGSGTGSNIKPQTTAKAKSPTGLDASDSAEKPDDALAERAAAEGEQEMHEEQDEEEGEREDDNDEAPPHETSVQNAQASQTVGAPLVAKTRLPATTAAAQVSQQSPKQDGSEKTGPSPSLNASNPPALMADTSSADDISLEASPSPKLAVERGSDLPRGGSSSSNGKEAAWDDTKLRAFFDESDHIRDLLVVVYDKTNVEPAGNDHPVVSGLFREQNAKLAEITTQLDNMLGDWLARKQRLRGAI
ncbi:hypothetical protein E4U42_000458 [Claviceps africana]|uniref:SH3 domain-containing protein n=1 Tax=Claviceps africana TaxID=83212 RepID=A0A8K0NJP3_9HYPO|nr:hypothetical protein E4U42_000458 [Claviceps africana]